MIIVAEKKADAVKEAAYLKAEHSTEARDKLPLF